MMTAEQFWQYWDDKKWAKPSPETVKPVCVAFAEAYHRVESAAQLAENEREIERLKSLVMSLRPSTLEARAEAAEQRLKEAQERPFCEGCDHGVVGGGICELCQGTGYKERRNPPHLGMRLREREAELEQALKLMRNYARGAISAELFRTKTETLLAEFTARQPLPSPPKEAKS